MNYPIERASSSGVEFIVAIDKAGVRVSASALFIIYLLLILCLLSKGLIRYSSLLILTKSFRPLFARQFLPCSLPRHGA